MAHTLQDRYGKSIDKRLNASLVTADNVIFNARYEGDPKAKAVQIPSRDANVAVGDYNKQTGGSLAYGSTAYITLLINKDKYVNELIDGYEALAVPDQLIADRVNSAGYSLSAQIDADSIACLESEGTHATSTAALSSSTVYEAFTEGVEALDNANVPLEGRWMMISPAVRQLIMLDTTHFAKASNLGDTIVTSGFIGTFEGIPVFMSNRLMKANTTFESGLSTTTEFILGHPDWCHRVKDWMVDPALADLKDGAHIGASAVQGRMIYGLKVSKAAAVYVKLAQLSA